MFNVGGHYIAGLVKSGETHRLLVFDLDTDEAELTEIDIDPYELACCSEPR